MSVDMYQAITPDSILAGLPAAGSARDVFIETRVRRLAEPDQHALTDAITRMDRARMHPSPASASLIAAATVKARSATQGLRDATNVLLTLSVTPGCPPDVAADARTRITELADLIRLGDMLAASPGATCAR